MRHIDVLNQLVDLAAKRRLALIEYRKPGEDEETRRLVEPYRLQEGSGNLMVQCWQVDPQIDGVTKWRTFRLDRIHKAADGGRPFSPRCQITLDHGEVTAFEFGHDPIQTLGPAAEYFQLIESSLLDGVITKDELAACQRAGKNVPEDDRRGAHAQVFCNVLNEVLADGAVSDKEVGYLNNVRKFLEMLGWAP